MRVCHCGWINPRAHNTPRALVSAGTVKAANPKTPRTPKQTPCAVRTAPTRLAARAWDAGKTEGEDDPLFYCPSLARLSTSSQVVFFFLGSCLGLPERENFARSVCLYAAPRFSRRDMVARGGRRQHRPLRAAFHDGGRWRDRRYRGGLSRRQPSAAGARPAEIQVSTSCAFASVDGSSLGRPCGNGYPLPPRTSRNSAV